MENNFCNGCCHKEVEDDGTEVCYFRAEKDNVTMKYNVRYVCKSIRDCNYKEESDSNSK